MELGESSVLYQDALDIKFATRRTIRSDKLIYKEQCLVFQSLVYSVVKYAGRHKEVLQSHTAADPVGKELVRVLEDEGLHILRSCADSTKASPGLISIILGSLCQFCQIIDDVSRYSEMIDRLITVDENIKFECKFCQSKLTLAHQKDKLNLKKSLKSSFRHIPKDYLDKVLTQSDIPLLKSEDLSPKEELLGRGSFGEVHKHKLWDAFPVAVKYFLPEHFSFEDEIRVLGTLTTIDSGSPHIVQIIGHSKRKLLPGDRSNNCLVLELMDTNLGELLNGLENLLELGQAVEIMLQIAKGMEYLHRNEVAYRDMKPSNILVTKRGESFLKRGENFLIKIADFGEAKPDFNADSTNTNLRGTRSYMAPEILDGKYSNKVDVFSFGIVCYQILTGQSKLEGNNRDELKKKVTEMEICKKAKELILSCLESNDENRPTFKIICEELWRIKEELLTGKEAPPTPVPEVTESQQSQFLTPIHEITSTRRIILVFELPFFNKCNLKSLRIGGQLNDIIFPCINIDDSGRAHLMDEWNSISRPFTEDDGVDPQNRPFGNLPQDLGVVGQFKKLLIDQGKRFNLSLGIHTSHQGILGAESLEFISEFLQVYKIFNGIYIQYHGTVKAINHVNMQLQQLRKALPGFTIGLSPSIDILPSIGNINPDMFDHLYISANYLRQLSNVPSMKIIIDGGSELNLVKEEDLGGVVFYCNEDNHKLLSSAQLQQSLAECERVASDLLQQNIVGDNDVAQTKEDLIPRGCARLEYQRQGEVATQVRQQQMEEEKSLQEERNEVKEREKKKGEEARKIRDKSKLAALEKHQAASVQASTHPKRQRVRTKRMMESEMQQEEDEDEDDIALVAAPVYHDDPMDTELQL